MKKILMILLGNICLAFAVSSLILGNEIIVGGVSGFGNVVSYYSGISISLCVMCINIILFSIGLLFIGKSFALKTLISTFLFPMLLEFFNHISMIQDIIPNLIFASVLGGSFIGMGVTLIIKAGASTGGFDILAILMKQHLNIPMTLTISILDLIILLMQCAFHKPFEILLGIIAVVLTGYTMNKFLNIDTEKIKNLCYCHIKKISKN